MSRFLTQREWVIRKLNHDTGFTTVCSSYMPLLEQISSQLVKAACPYEPYQRFSSYSFNSCVETFLNWGSTSTHCTLKVSLKQNEHFQCVNWWWLMSASCCPKIWSRGKAAGTYSLRFEIVQIYCLKFKLKRRRRHHKNLNISQSVSPHWLHYARFVKTRYI